MTAQERIYTAIDGGVPDRVPVVPKIWVDLGARLTGTPLADVVSDPLTALQVIARAGSACRVDAVRQFHFPRRRIKQDGERVFEVDEQGEVLGEIDMAGGLGTRLLDPVHFDITDPRFMGYHHYWSADVPFVGDRADAERMAVPSKEFYLEQGCGERQRQVIEELGEEVAVLGDCSSATMAFLVCMRGMNRALFDLIEEPELVHAIMEKGAAIAIEKGKFNIDMGLKILRLNDSVGNMSVISPDHWRQFVFPHMKEVCDALHAYDPKARIYCHICGNILPIAEDLVDTGLDCIGPLDPLGNFNPAQVRERVGEAVSLMGGVNTLTFLNGTPGQIIEESIACMEQAGGQGGYILCSGCVVPRDAPQHNLIALREAAETYGIYENGHLLEAR
jgi:uroporphyrinogen-III decarboxylase